MNKKNRVFDLEGNSKEIGIHIEFGDHIIIYNRDAVTEELGLCEPATLKDVYSLGDCGVFSGAVYFYDMSDMNPYFFRYPVKSVVDSICKVLMVRHYVPISGGWLNADTFKTRAGKKYKHCCEPLCEHLLTEDGTVYFVRRAYTNPDTGEVSGFDVYTWRKRFAK